jgi:hypothetical protein
VRDLAGVAKVIMNINKYERCTALEDAVWAQRAIAAEAEGYASPKDVRKVIRKAGLKFPKSPVV